MESCVNHYLINVDGTVAGIVEMPTTEQVPLAPVEVLATLLAVIGTVSIEDAANAVGRQPEDLIAEAQAWAVAQQTQP